MRGTFPRNVGLLDLVGSIEDATLALPEFQRDFEWQDLQVEALLTTLLKGWPAGSLLFLEASGSLFFQPRSFKGGPDVMPHPKSKTIVLDGQQRLTALYHALTGAGEAVYTYGLDLTADLKTGVDDVEDALSSYSRRQWAGMLKRSTEFPVIDGRLLIPFTALRNVTGFYDWRDRVVEQLSGQYPDISYRLREAYAELFENLHSYGFPIIFVDSHVEPEAVARIFERVNRNSEPLSTFDLLVARTFKEGWNMRELWAEARLRWPILDQFYAADGTVVIETLSLASAKPSVRKSDVLDLNVDYVRAEWWRSVEAVAHSLERLKTECGCLGPDFLPYSVLVPLYSAMHLRMPDRIAVRSHLRHHFFISTFGLRFGVAANTRIVEEWRVLSGPEDMRTLLTELSQRRPVSRLVMTEATRQSHGAIWRGVACLLASRVLGGDGPAPVPASLWQRRPKADWHLRAASALLLSPDNARLAARGDLITMTGDDAFRDIVRGQLVPNWVSPEDLLDATFIEAVNAARADELLSELRREFDAVIEEEVE